MACFAHNPRASYDHLTDDQYAVMMQDFYKSIPDPPRNLVKRYGPNWMNRADAAQIQAADRKQSSTRSRMLREYKSMVDESNRRYRARQSNPLFLPKSLFDSYIVKSDGGEVKVDKIQTLAGAERKVRELAKKYPCVGFSITSAKHGSVIKHYAASVGKAAPKVDEDNSREYKRTATKEAKANVRFRLYVNGEEFAEYETKGEAEKVGREEAGRTGKWRVREVAGNPSIDYSPNQLRIMLETYGIRPEADGHYPDFHSLHSFQVTGLLAREEFKGYKPPRGASGSRGRYLYEHIVRKIERGRNNPLTGSPSHDIPLLRREHYPQRQAVAIAMDEQRRRNPEFKLGKFDVFVERIRLNSGGYDRSGHYYGVGAPVFHYETYPFEWNLSGEIRANDLRHAKEIVKKKVEPYSKIENPRRAHYFTYLVIGDDRQGNRNSVEVIASTAGNASRKAKSENRGQFVTNISVKRLTPTARPNPEGDDSLSSAESLYSDFHGEPSDGTTEYVENEDIPDTFVELGTLISMKLKGTHVKSAEMKAPDPETHDLHSVVKLVSTPDGKQIYFLGGDQRLDLKALGFSEREERRNMMIGVLTQVTYRTRKGFDKFREIDYYHNLGEESGSPPYLTYDPINCRMHVTGGNYEIRDVGLVD